MVKRKGKKQKRDNSPLAVNEEPDEELFDISSVKKTACHEFGTALIRIIRVECVRKHGK